MDDGRFAGDTTLLSGRGWWHMTGTTESMQVEGYRVDLGAIIDSSDDGIIAITSSGLIAHCNRAAALLYGYRGPDLIGIDAQVLVPPELRAAEALILRRVAAGENPGSHRTLRLRRDGTVVPVVMAISPIFDSAGAVIGAAVIAHPVNELQNVRDGADAHEVVSRGGQPVDDAVHRDQDVQDRRFQAHVDAEYASERAEVSDAQDRFEVIMGDERAQERVQVEQAQDQFQLRMEEERAEERVQVEQAQDRFQLRMGEERAEEKVQVQHAQDRFQLRMSEERAQEKVQVQHAQDRFQLRMGEERAQERIQVEQAQDQFQLRMGEERAEARADRERLQAQLHQGQRLEILGQLAGGVAHDFNNLLAVILNCAAFVSEELATEPEPRLQAAGRDVEQIQRAAERAAELTHQLLAFARREVVQPRPLDLNHIVVDVENLLRRTIGDDINLSTSLAPQLWPVLADAGQIEQVLVNLAVNARDAMSDGGTLSIDTANVVLDTHTDGLLQAGRYVRLRVGDTGAGMSAEVIEHAFEPFFSTKRDGAGTGLGLSTVYGIVAQAEGAVTIDSQPGTGTTFTILIPVTTEAAAPADEPLPYERTPAGETVLIVEDQEALREVTARIFTRSGYHVITAANGAEAVTFAAQHDGDIHLLLTDVVMPNMLGKEVAEKIRQARPDIEVLFMSGYAQPVLASQGRLDPDVSLIDKPFSAAAIIEKAGRLLSDRFDA
jgi:two-component system cell cycle sensor histidine kinase/response regulator CckA